jgi:ubiquitin-conjugating enzyme E2 S
VNTLKKDWKSTYGVGHILVTVKCLLIYPNPESALDEEAGKMFMENYETYCSRAKLFTGVHARGRPEEFDTPSNHDDEGKVEKTTSAVVLEPVASSSKTLSSSSTTSTVSTPPLSTSSSTTSVNKLGLPFTVARKASSPAPPTLKSMEKEGSGFKQERHASPAPLSTADANVEGKSKLGLAGSALGLGLASTGGLAGANGTAAGGSKSMKRAATSSAVSGAEKRKKALKRL